MESLTDDNLAIVRIKRHYSLMSAKERKAADYIINNPQKVVVLSTAEIARKSGVSSATLIRFSKSIGFSGLGDFKRYLKHEMLYPNEALPLSVSQDSMDHMAIKTLEYNKHAIDETLAVMNLESLTEATETICNAQRIVILSEGGSGCSASCAYYSFIQIGLRCSLIMDPFYQVLESSQLGPGDVAMGICHSGSARNTVDAIQLAKENGAVTISIVGIVGSPITKFSDILLYTGLAENNFCSETIAVRICELSVLSVLHFAVAFRKMKQLDDYRRINSELFEKKRYQK